VIFATKFLDHITPPFFRGPVMKIRLVKAVEMSETHDFTWHCFQQATPPPQPPRAHVYHRSSTFRAIGHNSLLCNLCWRGQKCLNNRVFCTSSTQTAWSRNNSTTSMKQSPSWKANNYSVNDETPPPTYYATRRFIIVYTIARHWFLSWARRTHCKSSHLFH
jgi:hypothetical protein